MNDFDKIQKELRQRPKLNEVKMHPVLRKVNNSLKGVGESLPKLKKAIFSTRDSILQQQYAKLVSATHEIEFRIEELQDQLG